MYTKLLNLHILFIFWNLTSWKHKEYTLIVLIVAVLSIMIVDILFLGFDIKSYRLICHFRILRNFPLHTRYAVGETKKFRRHNIQNINSSIFISQKIQNWFKKIQRQFGEVTTIRILAYPLSKKYQSVLFRLRYLDHDFNFMTTRSNRDIYICLSMEEETARDDMQIRNE